jgi:hypothetical protein
VGGNTPASIARFNDTGGKFHLPFITIKLTIKNQENHHYTVTINHHEIIMKSMILPSQCPVILEL